MTEGLKAARERMAAEVNASSDPFNLYPNENPHRHIVWLARDLQRQAMEAGAELALVLLFGENDRARAMRNLREDGFAQCAEQELDGLAAEHVHVEPPPHHPPRCMVCGQHEPDHPLLYASVLHSFQPQAPWCHRAHPHQEPCGPKPKAWEERERQAAAETRGWDGVSGGGDE